MKFMGGGGGGEGSFIYRKSLFKNVLGHNICICQPIFKSFAAHFAISLVLNCAKKIFHPNKTLSDTREKREQICWCFSISSVSK